MVFLLKGSFIVNALAKAIKASMSDLFEVEITTTLGCPVRCTYCPQDQLLATRGDRKRILSFEDFVRAIDNIDFKVGLAWTGYSEPCLSPHLRRMLDYAKNKGFTQVISTTLSGNAQSVNDAISFSGWDTFSFHLPDSHGLMSGLRVTQEYAELLDYALQFRLSKLGQRDHTRIICFGEKFHPLIDPVIRKYVDSGLMPRKFVKLRGQVSTRSGGLGSKDLQKVLTFISDDKQHSSDNSNNAFFFCNKYKLNQPCLLPDGSMNICSFDYGFRCVYGNLFEEKLSAVYNEWINAIANDYLRGRLSPCTECEHYVPMKLKS